MLRNTNLMTISSVFIASSFFILGTSNSLDFKSAKDTISRLYKETNKNFLWIKERKKEDKANMKKYYNSFFTDNLSDIISDGLSNETITRYFSIDLDPRFISERCSNLRKKVIYLKIHDAVNRDKNQATVRVDYKTDQTDGDTYVTVYFLKLEKKRWVIDDQDLGRSLDISDINKKTKFKPDLREVIYAQ